MKTANYKEAWMFVSCKEPRLPHKVRHHARLEEQDEIRQAIRDLADIGLDILTLGQYLQPSAQYTPIARWATPEEFAQWKEEAHEMGIDVVESGPLVRSSYHAEEQSARYAQDKRVSA